MNPDVRTSTSALVDVCAWAEPGGMLCSECCLKESHMHKSFTMRCFALNHYLRIWAVFHSGGLFVMENIMGSSGPTAQKWVNASELKLPNKQSILYAGSFTISKSFSETVVLTAWWEWLRYHLWKTLVAPRSQKQNCVNFKQSLKLS